MAVGHHVGTADGQGFQLDEDFAFRGFRYRHVNEFQLTWASNLNGFHTDVFNLTDEVLVNVGRLHDVQLGDTVLDSEEAFI